MQRGPLVGVWGTPGKVEGGSLGQVGVGECGKQRRSGLTVESTFFQ